MLSNLEEQSVYILYTVKLNNLYFHVSSKDHFGLSLQKGSSLIPIL
jgi:hypothetical protein